MSIIGLDIGGAQIKCSDRVHSESIPFPMWKQPERLAQQIEFILQRNPEADTLSVTMTGELADCFQTRREGVHFILDSVARAAAGREVCVWQTGGEFFSLSEAMQFPLLVAAANWHALATWAGRAVPAGNSVLIDIGSTTTDIIPIEDGIPLPVGRTDPERLSSGELVYTGVRRTPLCAISNSVNVDGQTYSLAAEVFATTLDIGLVLGQFPEDPANCETANGKPATQQNARIRLARMICSDQEELSDQQIGSLARDLQVRQRRLIKDALRKVLDRWGTPPRACIFAGEGEYLIEGEFEDLLPVDRISLNNVLGCENSKAACAFAVQQLAAER